MRRVAFCLYLSVLLVGCKQEIIEPQQQLAGEYVLDDGTGLTREYLSFDYGWVTVRRASDQKYPFAEGKIWNCNKSLFEVFQKQKYFIVEGCLTAKNDLFNSRPVEQKDGVLMIGDKKYLPLQGFDANPYSTIVAESEVTFNYTEQDISIPFSIDKPLPAGEAGVSTNNSQWITNLKVEDGAITGHLSATSTDRSVQIKLSYTHAMDVWVTVKQAPSTFIRPMSESLTVEYSASTQTLGYTIENPVATSTLTATTTATWISDIQVSGTQISFKVSENDNRANRSGTLTLRYVGAPDVVVPVTQKWATSSLTLTPSTQTVDYTGGSFSFDYTITNPREGVSVTAASQANWITNVAVSGNTISYKVGENNTVTRTGQIKLTYGSYATTEFAVTQTGKPVASLTLNKTELSLLTGYSETLIATVDPTDVLPQWSSSKPSVATVDQSGKVSAVGNGTATIYAKAGEKTATCRVTVTTAVKGVSLNKSSLELKTGESETLIATITPSTASNRSVTWTSSNTSAATVDQSGKVKAVANGTAKITVKTVDGGYTATCTVSVTTAVKGVSLNKSSLELKVGESETLIATINPSTASNQSVTWTSDNISAATVDQSGKVKAVANGTAKITVKTVDGGYTATCSIKVIGLLPSVSFVMNYNAKRYNSSSKSIPAESGASIDKALTLSVAPSSVSSDHVTISSNTYSVFSYTTSTNPLQLNSSNPNITIIIKAKTTSGENIIANRDNNYNWMARYNGSSISLHTAKTNVSSSQVVNTRTSPNIYYYRVSGMNVEIKSVTDNLSNTKFKADAGSNSGSFVFFRGYSNQSSEYWHGDFYWIYISRSVLTDAQIQQVIDYNESL